MVTGPDPVRPDGSLMFDPDTLRSVVRYLTRKVTEDSRRNGGGASTPVLLEFMASCAESVRLREVLASQGVPLAEPTPSHSGTVWITAAEAAGEMGCSPGYARRLAREGRVTGMRQGRDWLIDASTVDRQRPSRRSAA